MSPRFRGETPEFRDAAVGWLCEMAGATATTVFHCIEANPRADALPIGLAAGVVYSGKAKGQLDRPVGRMEERFLGGSSLEGASIDRLSGRGGGDSPPDHGPSVQEEPAPASR